MKKQHQVSVKARSRAEGLLDSAVKYIVFIVFLSDLYICVIKLSKKSFCRRSQQAKSSFVKDTFKTKWLKEL